MATRTVANWPEPSGGVVEDDPERRAAAALDRRHAVTHRRAVVAARAEHGALPRREEQERALLQLDHVGPRLGPRALLEQDELATVEVLAGAVEHGDRLDREGQVAVQVLVERVVAARAVAQDQRRRPRLAGAVALLEERVELFGVANVAAQLLRPPVRLPRERGVESVAG